MKNHTGQDDEYVFPVLTTERLVLRRFRPDDIESVYQGLSHPEVIRHYGVSYGSVEATQEQMDWFTKIEKEEKGLWWAVCNRQDQTFLGAVGFNNRNQEHRKTEMGYWLLPDYWGSGIIGEAGRAACEYAFQKMSVHRIEAVVETENRNSKKVMAQLGFELEGIMRDCEIKDGKFISLEMYAKLSRM
ncbi:GNAT family N-acetyltransferase [Chryseobacterium sp. SN22]|uniref:GNAT family N-acetyltransferase n=1 Tax=Chryseobacterium sp. SN22 TaxID=2606431 RepID=UPI0011EEB46F|nr:GNAT family N-acetyltransferase [Chryseobacterium sp. SN22]KAA0127774.1 GNAT family N-acetyltransferase [Chryseobacterium sp. SN22]